MYTFTRIYQQRLTLFQLLIPILLLCVMGCSTQDEIEPGLPPTEEKIKADANSDEIQEVATYTETKTPVAEPTNTPLPSTPLPPPTKAEPTPEEISNRSNPSLDPLIDTELGWIERFSALTFDRYEFDQDCSSRNEDLRITRFEFEYPTGMTLSTCDMGDTNTYLTLEANWPDVPGLSMDIAPYNLESSYVEDPAESLTKFVKTAEQFVATFDSANRRENFDIPEDVNYVDFDIEHNDTTGFIRLATLMIDESKTGLILRIVAPAYSEDLEAEYNLFSAYAERIMNSMVIYESLDQIDSAVAWENRYADIEFETYSQTLDCLSIASIFSINTFSIDIPAQMTTADCSEQSEGYALFTEDTTALDALDTRFIVGAAIHPTDPDDYRDWGNTDASDFLFELAGQYGGILINSSVLEIEGRLYLRNDYRFTRDGADGFMRYAFIPNFQTGAGVLLALEYPVTTNEIDQDYYLMDAITKRMIKSFQFGDPAVNEAPELVSSGVPILESVDLQMSFGQTIAFAKEISSEEVQDFIFYGNAGETASITLANEQELSVVVQNLLTEEVYTFFSGYSTQPSSPAIRFILPELGPYRFRVFNDAAEPTTYNAWLRATPSVYFEIDPDFFMISSYGPGQATGFLLGSVGVSDQFILQAMPHPEQNHDLQIEITSFNTGELISSQDSRGAGLPEDLFHIVSESDPEPPYFVSVTNKNEEEAGIFMLTSFIKGEGNLYTAESEE